MPIPFDASLPAFVKILAKRFGQEQLSSAAVIRDVSGRLSAVLPDPADSDTMELVTAEVRRSLGAYARPDIVIRDASAMGAQRLLEEAARVAPLDVEGVAVRLLDRRFVGPDWLKPPAPTATGIPRIVFASLKGGVGRSTALCVVAAHLSRLGRRVLAVDFDLEAPGLGSMLLNENELPPYGTLDYLVENGLSGIDDTFMADVAGDSFLGSEGARVTIVPAIGKATFDSPGGALSKIARAYLEQPTPDGPAATLSDQLRAMIERFEATGAYDVVLIDARAGLHETTPAAVLGLGAEVLLFGIDQPQTFLGYRLLMVHLARFPVNPDDDWRERLNFVHARASDNKAACAAARERFHGLYDLVVPRSATQDEDESEPLTAQDFDMEWDDSGDEGTSEDIFTPPPVLHVLDDRRYADFDPISDRTLLASRTCAITFESLIAYAERPVIDLETEFP
jgi:MinD-like ATPase involved in chromosome partitioning or flagellar assembly